MAVFGSGGARFGRRARVLAAAAACWTIACVWLASAELRGFMKQTNPATYRALAHALDYPSEWWISGRGIRFGPVDLDVRVPPSSPAGETVILAGGVPLQVNQLALDRVDAGHVRLILSRNEDTILETGPIPVTADRIHVRLSAPWLYPPPEHPYWDRVADASRRLDLQTLFAIDWGSGSQSVRYARSFDESGYAPAALGAQAGYPNTPYIESIAPAAPGP
jgi:hypothetical protein